MGTPALWVGFNLLVVVMLAVDLGLFRRRAHSVTLREAAVWSAVWVALSLLLNLALLRWYGAGPALEFFTAYLIEKSLSVDNLFVFALLFGSFGVEPRYQHRVLSWGVLGALVMRGGMIVLGIGLLRWFDWVLYVFGALVLYAGLRMLRHRPASVDPEKSRVTRWARKLLPITSGYDGPRFVVRRDGAWRATPLLLVLLVIELTDLAFAMDSIPAVFAITRDPFIAYSSNVCAILGLRAFYFLLAGLLPYFRFLGQGLAAVLIFVGAKMMAEPWLKIPTAASLAVVAAILLATVLISVLTPAAVREAGARPPSPKPPAAEKNPTEV